MNLKLSVRIFFLVLIANIRPFVYAQSYSSGLQIEDEVARTQQLNSKLNPLYSFCVRPIYYANVFKPDSITNNVNFDSTFSSEKIVFLPLTLKQQFNTHHPYGWNDGSMIPAKGYQNQLSFGFFLKKGLISIQLKPELVFAQNSSFSTFPSQHNDTIWRTYYNSVLNVIDAPERLGTGSYLKLFPGQSSVRINYRKLSFGISTENIWWGPGVRNSLLMSNNAPGFPHLSFNSTQPVTSSIGSFEWQLISGKLKASGILPDTTKKVEGRALYIPKNEDGDRYINGIVFTWQPKWTKGLFLGVSRLFYQYMSDVPASFDGYMPVMGKFFKNRLRNEDEKRRDQLLSFFFRLTLPKERAEVYGEFGRNDHSANSSDFLREPEHSRAYIIGFSKTFDGAKKDLQLFGEIANLQMPSTLLLRAQEPWYTHYQVQHGYTNYGQVVGAGIGPGGSSETVGLQWCEGFNRVGGTIERVVHNNDFYYAFSSYEGWQKHWVDLSLNFNKSWQRKRIVYDARLSFVHSLNYEWYYDYAFNISARIGITYLF